MHEFCYAILDSLFKLVQRSFPPVICERDEGCHVWLFCVEIDIIPNQSIHHSINLTTTGGDLYLDDIFGNLYLH